jgi:hypothetical protein
MNLCFQPGRGKFEQGAEAQTSASRGSSGDYTINTANKKYIREGTEILRERENSCCHKSKSVPPLPRLISIPWLPARYPLTPAAIIIARTIAIKAKERGPMKKEAQQKRALNFSRGDVAKKKGALYTGKRVLG